MRTRALASFEAAFTQCDVIITPATPTVAPAIPEQANSTGDKEHIEYHTIQHHRIEDYSVLNSSATGHLIMQSLCILQYCSKCRLSLPIPNVPATLDA
jgi:Asp-tRNA(Asn)/Glu-tRNA(Gln) amidotransferase A subunit family amidase